MKEFLDWVFARAKEPSTRNGLAVGLTAMANYAPYPYSWIMLGLAAALGGSSMVVKDKPVPPVENKVP